MVYAGRSPGAAGGKKRNGESIHGAIFLGRKSCVLNEAGLENRYASSRWRQQERRSEGEGAEEETRGSGKSGVCLSRRDFSGLCVPRRSLALGGLGRGVEADGLREVATAGAANSREERLARGYGCGGSMARTLCLLWSPRHPPGERPAAPHRAGNSFGVWQRR